MKYDLQNLLELDWAIALHNLLLGELKYLLITQEIKSIMHVKKYKKF